MKKVNENAEPDIKIIKHYIRDLSFENPQSLNDNNAENNKNKNASKVKPLYYELSTLTNLILFA